VREADEMKMLGEVAAAEVVEEKAGQICRLCS
jgi:hypothetical protein